MNDAPTAPSGAVGTAEEVAVSFDLKVIADDVETPDSGLVFAAISGVPNTLTEGTLVSPSNGAWTFTPVAGFVGTLDIGYSVTDTGQGSSPAITSTGTIQIVVSPLNDAPVNSVPGAQTTNEDTTLEFKTANSNVISVSDPDVAETSGGQLEVNLTVTNGVLELVLSGATTITGGANNTSNVKIKGIPSDLNNTLNGLKYKPTLNFNGSALLTVETNDLGNTGVPNAQTDTDTVNITVTAVNDLPVGVSDAYSVFANADLTVAATGVLGNDTDVESNPLTVKMVNGVVGNVDTEFTLGSGAKVKLNANGSFTYKTNGAFNSLGAGQTTTDTFTYRVGDPANALLNTNVVITITGVNDKPTTDAQTATTNEDTAVVVNVLAGDNDVDPDAPAGTGGLIDPTTVVVSAASNGTTSVNPTTGHVTFTPTANYSGAASFTYTVKDDAGLASDPRVINITVNPVNDAPVATADSYTTAEDTTLTIAATGVLANDTDIDGPSMNAVLVSAPTSGSVFLFATGGFTYTPAANFIGTASFSYKASDGSLDSNVVVVNINVTSINDAPTVVNDTATTNEDTPVAINVLTNDSDLDPDAPTGSGGVIDPSTVTITSGPANGSTSVNPTTGVVTYSPASNYFGPDSFKYTVKDDAGLVSSEATVNITVTPVNDAPLAVNDGYATDEETPLTVAAPGFIGNDTDVESSPLTATQTGALTPAKGILTFNADGSLGFNPNGQFNSLGIGETENVTFKYTVSDGTASSNTATVTVTVNGVNDQPVATPAFLSTAEDTMLSGTVSGTDADTTDALTYLVSLVPSSGTLVLNSNGTFTYTPGPNFSGSDAFSFIARDDSGQISSRDSAPAVVFITVQPVNDAPIVSILGNQAVLEDAGAQTVSGFLTASTGPANESGQTLLPYTVTTVSTPSGLFSSSPAISGAGVLTYTPAAGMSGTATVTVVVKDDGGTSPGVDSTTVSFQIAVGDVNDPPVATADAYSATEDTPLVVNGALGVLANDSDPDGPTLQAQLMTGPTNGTLSLAADGSFTYTPNSNFAGVDNFTYRATDGSLFSSPVNVQITVGAVNDDPVLTITNPGATIAEGSGLVGLSSLVAVSDVDIDTTFAMVKLTAPAADINFSTTWAGPGTVTIATVGLNREVTINGNIAAIASMLATVTLTVVDADPNAGPSESIPVTVFVTDQGGTGSGGAKTDTDTLTILATDVVPSITLSGASVHSESTTPYQLTISGLSDPGADLITLVVIHWGDGSPDTTINGLTPAGQAILDDLNGVAGDGSIVVTHPYLDGTPSTNATTIIVDLVSQGNTTQFAGIDDLVVNVQNVAPSGIAHAPAGSPWVEGTPGTLIVEATDPSAQDLSVLLYSYDFNGDGDYIDAGEIVNSASSTVTIPGSFIPDNGSYTVKVKIDDQDGGVTVITRTEVVGNVNPDIPTLANENAIQGSPYLRSVTFVDPGTDIWTATVDYGDGNGPVPATITGKTVQLSNTYSVVGNHTVTLTVTDDDGGIDTASFVVNVQPPADTVAPTITNLRVASSAWDPQFTSSLGGGFSILGASRAVSWTNLDQLIVTFSEAVVGFTASDVILTGDGTPGFGTYTVGSVSVHPTLANSFIVQFTGLSEDLFLTTPSQTVNPDVIAVAISVGAVSDTSGNLLGAAFNDSFTAVPGDIDGDLSTTLSDAVAIIPLNGLNLGESSYDVFADFDGDTFITLTDLVGLQQRLGTSAL